MSTDKQPQSIQFSDEYEFSSLKKLAVIATALALNAALVCGFLSYFGKRSSPEEEFAPYADSTVFASVNLFGLLNSCQSTLPVSES